jgi:hypothetical protein
MPPSITADSKWHREGNGSGGGVSEDVAPRRQRTESRINVAVRKIPSSKDAVMTRFIEQIDKQR